MLGQGKRQLGPLRLRAVGKKHRRPCRYCQHPTVNERKSRRSLSGNVASGLEAVDSWCGVRMEAVLRGGRVGQSFFFPFCLSASWGCVMEKAANRVNTSGESNGQLCRRHFCFCMSGPPFVVVAGNCFFVERLTISGKDNAV